jgi:diguanylate cyclase (GGDEF)-like protein/PAS domain S-box-containing protein
MSQENQHPAGPDGRARDERSSADPALRRRAEAMAATDAAHSPETLQNLSPEETGHMLRALRVHQIELEMQNDELRRAQLELDTERARYFDLYDLAPVGYCTLDERGLILQANLTAATLLGLPRQQLILQPIFRFILKADQDIYYLYRKQLHESGEARSCELRMVKMDGTPFWARLVATNTRDADGALVHRVMLGDVSDRKLMEAELRIAATAFESQEGIFVTDVAGVILRVNRAFTEITDYSAQDAIGQTPHLLSSGRHDAAFYTTMSDSIASTGSSQGEIWNRRKGGEVYPAWLTITAVKDDAGLATHYVASFTDITLRKTAADQITRLAFYDPLTGLPNRRLLMDRLEQALAAGERHRRQGALMLIDLDHFKTLNDTLGHDQGDLLLVQVARRLTTCIRDGDTVARLGGDEFVVMLEDLSVNAPDAATQAEAVGEKILAALNQPYQLSSQDYHSTPSIGVTLFADQQVGIDELLKRADLAMYQAKAAGRNTVRFFDPQMQAVVTARAALETGLREAVRDGQFLLHYQPQVADGGQLCGVEALVRWQHPQRGLVAPAEFIALAEDTGLILPLGQWVLETACTQLATWATQPGMAHLTIAVNVSARQFHQKEFVANVLAALGLSGANPRRLKLELTEGLLVDNLEDVIAKMNALKAEGVGFSLDDFGTGYSSLSYLKRLPLDQLKIDQSFVRDLLTDPNDTVIARAIVALGHNLGLQVIAEGMESADQYDVLASLGCDAYQGYYFGRPAAASALAGLMIKTPSSPHE